MLKSLELSGFKSFAKKTKMDFTSPISAIVGPNGSGKSNAAEAFSFVLGEQSMKSIRTKKSEDLLFNGSHAIPRSNRAHVSLTFDNSNGLLEIDFDEVTVERIVHRDSSNEYLINGSPVRLKDIVELVSRANIGSSGHHIISQGEADKILMVRPKERKLMIEDALGLKIYHIKRKEALKKLSKTDENLKDIKGLRKEIEPHFNYLKKQVHKFEKSKELRETLLQKALVYFKARKHELETRGRELTSRDETLQKIEDLGREIQTLEGSDVGNEKPDREALERLTKEIEKSYDELKGLERESGRIEGVLSTHVENNADESKVSIPKDVLSSVLLKLDVVREDNATLEHLKDVVISVRDTLSSYVSRDESKSADANAAEIEETLKEKKKHIEHERTVLEEAIERLKREKEEEEKRLRELDEERNNHTREIFEKKAEKRELENSYRSMETLAEQLESDMDRFKEDVGEVASLVGGEIMKYEEGDVGQIDDYELENMRREIERLKIRIEDMKVASEKELMNEYEDTRDRMEFLGREISDLTQSKKSLLTLIDDLENKLYTKFTEGIGMINEEFQRFFEMLFGGGEASLIIVRDERENSEIEEGVEIDVHLPHKKVKGLHMFSGGERALTSIALLFAMSQINPPPFIILDETDAALDEANSRKYGDMVEGLSEKSQLILITHNRETMSRAGLLYGITMGSDGISRLLSIEFEKARDYAKA